MATLTSKSGKLIVLRPPKAGDEQILFGYAQALEAEDTFVLLNSGQPVTWSEESNYLKTTLDKIRANWQVHELAFFENKLIGSSQISLQGRRKMHVGNFGISVAAEFRGDGIGELLAKVVIEEARQKLKIEIVTLEMFETNKVARSLYEKLGFVEYGRLPGGLEHKGVKVNAILMMKRLG